MTEKVEPELNVNKELLATQPNPFEKSREKSGSERKGGMPGEAGIQGAVNIRVSDFVMQSIESEVSIIANLSISYSPRKYVITPEDVSLYTKQYRRFTGTAEDAVELISRHFCEMLEPMTYQLQSEFAMREGVIINPSSQWVHPEFVRMQARASQQSGIALPPGVRPS
jgi:hypothetical protein